MAFLIWDKNSACSRHPFRFMRRPKKRLHMKWIQATGVKTLSKYEFLITHSESPHGRVFEVIKNGLSFWITSCFASIKSYITNISLNTRIINEFFEPKIALFCVKPNFLTIDSLAEGENHKERFILIML